MTLASILAATPFHVSSDAFVYAVGGIAALYAPVLVARASRRAKRETDAARQAIDAQKESNVRVRADGEAYERAQQINRQIVRELTEEMTRFKREAAEEVEQFRAEISELRRELAAARSELSDERTASREVREQLEHTVAVLKSHVAAHGLPLPSGV